MTHQLPTNQGVPVTPDLYAELRSAVRFLNLAGIYGTEEIASDSQVSRILADMAVAAQQQARAAA